jgi:cytochrome c oxidase subunit 2
MKFTLFKNLILDSAASWQFFFQDPATSIMENIIDLHHDIVFFLIVIIVFTSWMMFRIIYLFNNTNTETERSLFLTHNTFIEIIWTLIPTLILLFIALPSYVLIYNMDEMNNPFMTIKIIGHQWYWSYEYPDLFDNITFDGSNIDYSNFIFDSYMIKEEDLIMGHLRLLDVDNNVIAPTDLTIRLLITASDVIHSWTIPSLGVKVDAVPGRLNQISTFINRRALFYGQCSELCGINHSFMPIGLKAVEYIDFLNWINEKKN